MCIRDSSEGGVFGVAGGDHHGQPQACANCLTVMAACLVLQEVIVTVKTQACDT